MGHIPDFLVFLISGTRPSTNITLCGNLLFYLFLSDTLDRSIQSQWAVYRIGVVLMTILRESIDTTYGCKPRCVNRDSIGSFDLNVAV